MCFQVVRFRDLNCPLTSTCSTCDYLWRMSLGSAEWVQHIKRLTEGKSLSLHDFSIWFIVTGVTMKEEKVSLFNNVLSIRHTCIWHKSAIMGDILNEYHNFNIFSTSVWPECYLSRGQLAVPGQTSCRQSKNITWHHLEEHVEAFQEN